MSFRCFRFICAAAIVALTYAAPAAAATCSVPGTHATLAAALADTTCTDLQVAAGTYSGNFVVSHSMTITGAGQAATFLDAGGSGRVLDIAQSLTVTINDLSVSNGNSGDDNGAGIRNGSANSPQPGTGATLTLNRVTVSHNDAGDGFGGGIENNRYGTLTLNFCTVSANHARDGGGIGNVIDSTATINDSVIGGATDADGNRAGSRNYSGFGAGINNGDGTMYVNRSVIAHNRSTGPYGPGPGGGIDNDQTNGYPVLTITDSTLSNNYAEYGGGIAGDGSSGSITISGSTLMNNTAQAYFASGGAIWLYNGHTLTMTNSTMSGNVASGDNSATGGAIGTIAYGNGTSGNVVRLTNVTVTNNAVYAPNPIGGGIGRQSGVQFAFHNTIISGNVGGASSATAVASDCAGSLLVSNGHNLFGSFGNANGCPADGTTDVVPAGATSTAIDPLADNGGPTLTHSPVSGGPAVDAGDDSVALTTDQTGAARIFGAHIDIGSVELAYNTPPRANAGGPYTVSEGGSVVVDGGASTDAEQASSTLSYAWDLDNDGVYETAGQTATFSAAGLDGPSGATIGLQVCDNANACATTTASISIVNVAPSVTLSGTTINEGGTATVTGTIADPGPDSVSVTLDWADGTAPQSLSLAAGTTSFSASHVYVDDDPTGTASDVYAVSATATDDDGGVGGAATQVTVNNVAPSVTLSASSTGTVGQPFVVSGTFADPGVADTFTASITWGDGTTSPVAASGGIFSASHQYAVAGPFNVTACVSDDDGGSGCAAIAVTIANSAACRVGGDDLRTPNRTFGEFNLRSHDGGVTGELEFRSPAGQFHANQFTSLGVSADGHGVWFTGVGHDGRAFSAYAEDHDAAGRDHHRGSDVFQLWIDGVLQNGSGITTSGHVEIHCDPVRPDHRGHDGDHDRDDDRDRDR